MSKLQLSEEDYNTDVYFKLKCDNVYKYKNWITDGYSRIDTTKVDIRYNFLNTKELEERMFNDTIKKAIKKEHLEKILNTKHLVKFSDVSLKGYTLASTEKTDTLIDSFYIPYIKCLDVFYKDNIFYLFYENEAEPSMGIDFDSEMFIGMIMGIDINERKNEVVNFSTLDILRKLKRLNEYYQELRKVTND